MTDNKNRTLPEIRNIFTKLGCQLGSSGSVAYQFKKQGVIRIQSKEDKEDLEEKAIESGAQDYRFEDDQLLILTDLPDLQKVKEYFDSQEVNIESAKIECVPQTTVELSDADEDRLIKLLDELDGRDDVSEIYSNAT